jgi:hypothetical protein
MIFHYYAFAIDIYAITIVSLSFRLLIDYDAIDYCHISITLFRHAIDIIITPLIITHDIIIDYAIIDDITPLFIISLH